MHITFQKDTNITQKVCNGITWIQLWKKKSFQWLKKQVSVLGIYIEIVKYTDSTPRKWRAKYRQQQKKEVIMKLPKTKLSVKKLIKNKAELFEHL